MSEGLKIYDLDQVSCNFLGVPIEQGFGDGGAIKVEKVNPTFTVKEGADGSVVRSKTGKKTHKITITLLQTSAGNAVLSGIHARDEALPNGAGVGPLLIADRQGSSLHHFSEAWIESMPAVEYNAEATNREWVLMGVATRNHIGGN